MTALNLIPVFVSFLLLAAHFSRNGAPLLAVLCLALPLLLLVRRRWVPRLLQLLLFVGALEWLRAALALAARRLDAGEPWIRMGVILATVALFTFASAMLLRTTRLRRRYGLEQEQGT